MPCRKIGTAASKTAVFVVCVGYLYLTYLGSWTGIIFSGFQNTIHMGQAV
jgi:hypothetical protein